MEEDMAEVDPEAEDVVGEEAENEVMDKLNKGNLLAIAEATKAIFSVTTATSMDMLKQNVRPSKNK